MSQLSLRWLILPSTLALIGAVLFAHPGVETAAESEDAASTDPELVAFSAELEIAQLRMSQRITMKEHLIAQLIEGHHTLDAVAAEFLRINQDSDICLTSLRRTFPGATDEEKSARNVMAFALDRARSPEQKQALQTRLAHEFEQLYGVRTPP